MVKKLQLAVSARSETNGQAKKIRRDGFIPAVLYGRERAALSLKAKKADLEKVYKQAGEATLLDIIIDGKETVKAVFKDTQKDAVRQDLIHADFYEVDMKEKLEVEVPLHFTGESKAVKELGGTLVKNMETVEVKCLPGDLIDKIDVDISSLLAINDNIKVADLKVPATIEIISHLDDTVALVMAAAVEEEAPVKPAEAEAAAVAEVAGPKEGEAEKKPTEKKPEGGKK